MAFSRLIAVDPSLTCSGWALFCLRSKKLLAVGKLRSLSPKLALAHRLKDLQDRIGEILARFELGSEDVLVCESQTTMRDPKAAFKVEQVRGIFESVARSRRLSVPGRINPRSVQSEVMGLKGKQARRETVKETAIHFVKTLYGAELGSMGFTNESNELRRHQDIIDAILVGYLGLARVSSAESSGDALETFFIPRPERITRRLPR